MTKYIFVTGGVLSSLGKGISSSSIGTLLKHANLSVSILKIDPYINVDPGTMSPLEHGEVFVTKDGAETDLDIGHYERFLNKSLSKENNFTTGQVYKSVIERERKGEYLGKTIQIVPHITDEIKSRIKRAGDGYEILADQFFRFVIGVNAAEDSAVITRAVVESESQQLLALWNSFAGFNLYNSKI